MALTPSTPQLSIRQRATTLAWQLVRTTRLSFKQAQAQAQAWATVRLLNQMNSGPTEFRYRKDDRSYRVAIGERPSTDTEKPFLIRYFDLEAGAIRSFRVDRLVIA